MTEPITHPHATITMRPDVAVLHFEAEGDDRDLDELVATTYRALDADLTAVSTGYNPGQRSGYSSQRRRLIMLRHKDGTIQIPRGLIPRAARCLRRVGWRVDVRDVVQWNSRFRPDRGVIEEQTDERLRIALESVCGQPRAQVEYSRREEQVALIRNIIRMYPSAGILIPAPTRSAAWHLWDRLRDLDCVQLARKSWKRQKRVVVCTFRAITSIYDPGGWQLVLVPEAHVLADDQPHRAVEDLLVSGSPKHVIAFRRSGLTFSRRQQLLIERLAGRVVHHVGPGHHPVRVVLHRGVGGGEQHHDGESELDRKRRHTWHHAGRNHLLARLARNLASEDEQMLRELGIRTPGLLDDLPEHPRVVVLVESVEHGRQLLRLLPGWTLHRRRGRIRSSRVAEGRHVGRIVTLSRAIDVGLDADVIVRGGGAWPMVDWPIRADCKDDPREHILVDIDDDHDPDARRAAHDRIRDYDSWEGMYVHSPANRSPGKRTPEDRPLLENTTPGGQPGRKTHTSEPGTDYDRAPHRGARS